MTAHRSCRAARTLAALGLPALLWLAACSAGNEPDATPDTPGMPDASEQDKLLSPAPDVPELPTPTSMDGGPLPGTVPGTEHADPAELPAQGAAPAGGPEIPVTLKEFEMGMPGTVPAGPVTFVLTNTGQAAHSFEIEGEGLERRLEQHLQPGQTVRLTVTLRPGQYKVYCPVGQHADKGMSLTLNAVEGETAPQPRAQP